MATAAADDVDVSIKIMEKDLSCNICYNLLKEPKELDCPHFFCLQCLEKWVCEEPTVECPECRHITILPPGGLTSLKTNLHLKSMAEKYGERIEKQEGVPICPNHEGEKQHFFCVTCGVTVCHNCLVLEHERPRHEIKELKAIAGATRSEMKAKIEHVDRKVKDTERKEKKLGELDRKLQGARIQANAAVAQRGQEAIVEVQTKVKEMKADVEATFKQRADELMVAQHQTKDALTRLHNVRTATLDVVDTVADHVLMKQQHASLVDKMDRLCENEKELPSSDLATLQFKPGSSPVNASWFGELVVCGNKKCELIRIHEFGTFELASGVAVTQPGIQSGLLAVADSAAGEVIIYSNVNGVYEPVRPYILGSSSGFPGREITKPFQVAVTSEGKFLVTHMGWIAKIFSSSGKCEALLHGVGDRIATTPADLIVIGSSLTGVITVHQSGGELIRKHRVDCKDMQAIASNEKQIAFTTGSKGNLIHVIDFVTGQTVWTADMMMPLGICYEPTTNSLLVAGGATELKQFVIEQYCSTTGRLLSRVASGLYNPFAMTVTQDSKLVVADLKTVKMYHIKIQ